VQKDLKDDWITKYHFKTLQVWELIKMALRPPAQMEAADWKMLAIELANRGKSSYWHYQWVNEEVSPGEYKVSPYEVHVNEEGLWARTENPVAVWGEDGNEVSSLLIRLSYDKDRYGIISMSDLDALIGTHPDCQVDLAEDEPETESPRWSVP